jgi:uncharacterized protein YlxW (UPF0749 family)
LGKIADLEAKLKKPKGAGGGSIKDLNRTARLDLEIRHTKAELREEQKRSRETIEALQAELDETKRQLRSGGASWHRHGGYPRGESGGPHTPTQSTHELQQELDSAQAEADELQTKVAIVSSANSSMETESLKSDHYRHWSCERGH